MSFFEKLKNATLDTPSQKSTPSNQPPDDNTAMHIGMGIAAVAIVVIMFWTIDPEKEPPEIGQNFCPLNETFITARTYVLMDLSNALTPKQQKDLEGTLEAVSTSMQSLAQVKVTRMLESSPHLREKLASFCSPDLSELDKYGKRFNRASCDTLEEKGRRYDWHPSISEREQERITETCEIKVEQEDRAKGAVKVPAKQGELRSHIISAIESTMDDLIEDRKGQQPPVHARLIIFSDMLQNTEWFSQYKSKASDWTFENLNAARKKQNDPEKMGIPPDNFFDSVLVCYLDRSVLNRPKKNLHRAMWKEYFTESADNSDFIYQAADDGECADKTTLIMALAPPTRS